MIQKLKTKNASVNSCSHDHELMILSKPDFQKLLKYERMRSEREGSQFSIILFNNISYTDKFYELGCEVKPLLRNLDQFGWFENCLGLILPVTNYDNAIKVCESLLDSGIFNKYSLSLKVFTYPDRWINSNEAGQEPVQTSVSSMDSENQDYSKKSRIDDLLSNYDNDDLLDVQDDIATALVKKIPLWKRTFDIVFSGLGLIVLAPLFILVALYIKLMSKGPVFFKQKRVGYKGKIFDFYKFRTMHVNNDQKAHQNYLAQLISTDDKPMIKLDSKKDNRIIRGGSILRKSSIDELPQLINVFLGDMSLVGPRPCLPYEEKEYLHWFRNRFNIVPGMTGLWQVSGKNRLTFKQMIRLDIKYIKHLSLWQDIKILILTVPTVLYLMFENTINKLTAGMKGKVTL